MAREPSDRYARTPVVRYRESEQYPCRRWAIAGPLAEAHAPDNDTCVQSQSEREAAVKPWAVAGNESASPVWGVVKFQWGKQSRPGI